MNFFKQYRADRFRASVLKELDKKTKPKQHTEHLEKIGILLEATTNEQRKAVQQYAEVWKKRAKSVHILGYINDKNNTSTFNFPTFSKKQINFWQKPKNSKDVTDFMRQSFDLLINLNPNQHAPLDYIAALADAKFKTGTKNDFTEAFDLMIDTDNQADMLKIIEEIEFYLNKIIAKKQYELKV